jgi:hypothetical protein
MVNELTFCRPPADPPQSPSTTLDSNPWDETALACVPPREVAVSAADAALIPLPHRGVYQVFSHIPALGLQQNANLSVSVSHSRLRDLPDAQPKSAPRAFVITMAKCPAIQPGYTACSSLAHCVAAKKVLDHLPGPPGL